ncbi:MAG TPA: hypothetical protein V6D05_16410 [Stenomitos sp.]
MKTRFLLETRFRGDDTVAAQLLKHKLVALGYRYRPQMRVESGEFEGRFQRFERRANDEDSLESETERLKSAGVWAGLRTFRFI